MKNFIKKLFINENNSSIKTNKPSEQNVVKRLFTKSDPLSLTVFPYVFSTNFFPPLDKEERNYMIREILRWYDIFIEVSLSELIENLIGRSLKPCNNNENCTLLYKKSNEKYIMLVQSVVEENIKNLINIQVNKLSDEELCSWDVNKGENYYFPPIKEFSNILMNLTKLIVEKANIIIIEENNNKKETLEIINQEMSYDDKKAMILNNLLDFINKNKKSITKHCYDRILLEMNAFPYYDGKVEKSIKNDIFSRYNYSRLSYNNLFGKVYLHLSRFMNTYSKRQFHDWLENKWDDYIHFIENHFDTLEIDELSNIDKNDLSFAIDFYVISLFKIYMDGIN